MRNCCKQGVVIAPDTENSFRSYREKVVYILQSYSRSFNYPPDLQWCAHVIKHDFLQINNSISVSTLKAPDGRRFSKTRRNSSPKMRDRIDHRALDNWVNILLFVCPGGAEVSHYGERASDFNLISHKALRPEVISLEIPMPDSLSGFEEHLNSNNFDAHALNDTTRRNVLYFILKYMFAKYEMADALGIDPRNWGALAKRLQRAYRDTNPYHNYVHAADVVQCIYYFMTAG